MINCRHVQNELYYISLLCTFQASCNTGTPTRNLLANNPATALRLAGFFIGQMATMDTRKSSSERGYGSRWQKARQGYLSSHPLCEDHKKRGHIVVATVVDHIVPHKGDMELFWDRGNWQSLCKQCHDSHKQRLEKSGRETGCDLSGLPLDPRHHWSSATKGRGESKV